MKGEKDEEAILSHSHAGILRYSGKNVFAADHIRCFIRGKKSQRLYSARLIAPPIIMFD